MDFKALFNNIKRWFKRTFKRIKKFFKKYFRRLVRHTKAGDYSLLIYTITAILSLILIIFLFGKIASSSKKKSEPEPVATTTDATEITEEEVPTLPPTPSVPVATGSDAGPEREPMSKSQLAKKANEIYTKDKDLLLLVNQNNPVPDNYTFEQHELNCGEIVNAIMYDDLCDMLQACNDAGHEYNIISGYRSKQGQQTVIDNDIQAFISMGFTEEEAKKKVAATVQMPGYSEHETGLSIDLSREGNWILDENLNTDKTYIWLANHCQKYGFIVRYPISRAEITGIDFEPWHFRYVGKDAAMLMYNNDLTLEEFYQLLEQ